MAFPPPESYRALWRHWVKDPLLASHGLTFDRTPAGPIIAPPGHIRVCGWNTDFDERPTCWMDVSSLAEAQHVCGNFAAACDWNVDYPTAHDGSGAVVAGGL